MDTPTAISLFSASGKDLQLRLLAKFGHNLTIEARDTYVPQADRLHTPARLRAINEIQHRVLGHIYSLLSNSDQRYPDDVMVQIMLEHDDQLLKAQTSRAFAEAWVCELPSNTLSEYEPET